MPDRLARPLLATLLAALLAGPAAAPAGAAERRPEAGARALQGTVAVQGRGLGGKGRTAAARRRRARGLDVEHVAPAAFPDAGLPRVWRRTGLVR